MVLKCVPGYYWRIFLDLSLDPVVPISSGYNCIECVFRTPFTPISGIVSGPLTQRSIPMGRWGPVGFSRGLTSDSRWILEKLFSG